MLRTRNKKYSCLLMLFFLFVNVKVVGFLTNSSNHVDLQCWRWVCVECEITLCSPRDKHNAINKMMINLVYERIDTNIVTFTNIQLTFECSCIPAKKIKLNFADYILKCQMFL